MIDRYALISIYHSIYLSLILHICLCIFLFIYLSIHLGPQQLKQLRQGLLSGRISREQLFTIRQAMIFQNKQKKAASTSTSAATASSEAATASTAASTTPLVASTSTTTAQSTSSLDPTSERQKEGLLLPGNQLSLSQSKYYSSIY